MLSPLDRKDHHDRQGVEGVGVGARAPDVTERIETARGDWDADGFHLTIVTDEGEREYLVVDTIAARDLLRAAAPLHAWEAEERLERNAYDRATPEERRAVIDPDGMLPSGAAAERMREGADLARKAERENRP